MVRRASASESASLDAFFAAGFLVLAAGACALIAALKATRQSAVVKTLTW